MADSKFVLDWLSILSSASGALATIIVTFVVYWLTIRGGKKALTYDYSTAKIAQVAEPFRGTLEISFQGRKVEEVSLVSLSIKNSGQAPIQRQDYDDDLLIVLPGSNVLALQISSCSPDNLSVNTQLREQNVIMVSPLLLNPGDQFTLLALVSGLATSLYVNGRIAGVTKIERRKDSQVSAINTVYGIICVFLCTILVHILLAVFNFSAKQGKPVPASLSLALLFLVSVVLPFWIGLKQK